MYDEVLFHGTEIGRGKMMLSEKQMEISHGDNHWLGDGVYLYEDDFYAYKWIRDMYKSKYQSYPVPADLLFEKYFILKVHVLTSKEKIFDLDKPINKIEFDRIYYHCNKNLKYSRLLKGKRFTEGTVLNIMFNNMGYSKEYDVVIATFNIRTKKSKNLPMRLDYISQKQVCVKIVSKSIPIEPYECKDKIKLFHNYIDNLYSFVDIDDNTLIYDKSYKSLKGRNRKNF